MPPPMASRMLSTSACVTICDRDAPIASRTAVCVRRATERASSRFATFAQAISSTSPHTAISICRLLAVLLFHHADAGAGRDDRDRLLRQQVVDVGQPVRRIARVVRDPLAQDVREPRRDAVGRGAGLEAADDAQPGGDRLAQQRVGAGDHRFLLKRNPEVGRIVAERIAEEARRRHADDRERVAFDDERLADERLIAAVDRSATSDG